MSAKPYVLALIPKFTGAISIAFSSLILYCIFRKRTKGIQVYDRLVLGMSVADLLGSFWMFMSTWPIPESSGVLWASGNQTTCDLQGVFTQGATIASAIYNGSVSFYFLLVVRLQWKSTRLQRYEWLLHAFPICWGASTGIAGLTLRLYNSANLWCFIAPSKDPSRGQNADFYRMLFFYGPLYLIFVIVAMNVLLTVSFIRRLTTRAMHFSSEESDPTNDEEDFMNEDDFDGYDESESIAIPARHASITSISTSSRRNREKTKKQNRYAKWRRKVSMQNFRFALSFYWTWIPISCVRMLQLLDQNVPFWLITIATITTPMQGLPNLLVYFYPKYRKFRKQKKKGFNILHWIRAGMQTTIAPGETTGGGGENRNPAMATRDKDNDDHLNRNIDTAHDESTGHTKNENKPIGGSRLMSSITLSGHSQSDEKMEVHIPHDPLPGTSSITDSEVTTLSEVGNWRLASRPRGVSSITISELEPICVTESALKQKWLKNPDHRDAPLGTPRRLVSDLSQDNSPSQSTSRNSSREYERKVSFKEDEEICTDPVDSSPKLPMRNYPMASSESSTSNSFLRVPTSILKHSFVPEVDKITKDDSMPTLPTRLISIVSEDESDELTPEQGDTRRWAALGKKSDNLPGLPMRIASEWSDAGSS